MDVRFFNFLARQPSAKLIERSTFCGLPKRGIALILVQAMFWQPLLAQADGIAVNGTTNTTMGQAGNGVPIVNIAAPNGSGLSHNQYQQYNVGAQGVILNNATDRTQSTQLGGIILGNQNLNGRAASTILNEVVGANATQLKGYTEVAGQSARVIVANPYGISCNGCGFINTPQVTLTTGRPVLDNGRLDHFRVEGGSVSIDGAGLNADNVDQFDIITRSAKINAELHAKKLNIIAGRNDVDAQTLNATALADDGSDKPQLAIDSSALGGMYAGAIRLVGTEAGVGVKLAGNLAASAGDIQIDANGQLSMAQVAANGAVNVKAASADVQGAVYGNSVNLQTRDALNVQQNIAARDRISLSSGGQLTNNAIVEAGVNADNSRNATGDVALSAQNLRNNGSVIASRSLQANAAQTLTNLGGTLSGQGSTAITAGTLDNQHNGRVLSNGSLSVTANQLLNGQGGLISSNADQTVHAASIDNQHGTLTSQGALTISATSLNNAVGSVHSQKNLNVQLTGDLNNTQGQLSSEALLSVSVATLANRLGVLSSAGQLSVNSTGLVDNQGGQLVTDAGLDLHSGSLDNRNAGTLSGKGAISVSTGAFDNSHSGSVSGGSSLSLNAGQVINQDKGRIASTGALMANVTGLDMSGGQLFSNSRLTLDLNHGQLNNQSGLITAPSLTFNNLGEVANQNGEISSAQAFTLAADSVDNSNGKLLSNQALTLRINQALNNVKGLIAAAAIDAHAGSVDNSGSGTLTSQGALDLHVDGQLNNQNDGLINAAQTLNVQATGINNIGGTLLGTTAVNLDLNGADLDNSNGLITTQNPLTISHLRDLKNASGEISSSQSFSLTGRMLDNSNGKLISNQSLTLNANSLLNQLGLISGWEGLDVSGGSLDNRNGGTLSSRNGDVGVSLTGALLNAANGALVSQKALNISAASVDNRGGILSSGAEQTYTVSGLLDNGQNGLIDSGAALTLNAATLGNAAGTINAQQALNFTGTDLDNSAGSIAGNVAVTLDLLGSLTNTNGKLASAGDLLVSRATQINNQGGQLASQRALTLFTGGLDNSNRGTVAANDQLLLTASGAIQNANDGLIYSKNANLTVQAASLANGKGTLQSQGAMDLTVSGDIDSQSGKIIAQGGNLNVTASNVDNRGGVLSSLQNAFTARITGVLKNGYDLNNNSQGGITQAQSLDIRALAGIDNYGGRISAQTGDALINTGSGNFDNRNGGLYAKQRVIVTANNFDNSGSNDGQIAGQQIDLTLSGALNNQLGIIESDSTLSITAASLNNQTGKLRALGTSGVTRFQIGGLLDNRNGTLETANTDLALGVGNLLNAGGSILHVGTGNFGLSTANVMNAGGSLVTRGGLTLNADSWTNSSVIQAGTLNVNVTNFAQTATGQLLASSVFTATGSNWSNDGLIASDGTLRLILGGTYSSNGRMTSLGNLTLGAAQLNLSSTASITGGATTAINVSGALTNSGRLSSASDLSVTAGSVANYGAIAASQDLNVTAQSLLNAQAADGSRGFLFSGRNMKLQAGTVTNRYADVYSLGTLMVTGTTAGSSAQSLINSSGSIEASGDISIAANSIVNQRDAFSMEQQVTGGYMTIRCVQHCDGPDSPRVRGPVFIYQTVESVVSEDSPMATLVAGHDLTINSTDFLNQYSLVSAAHDLSITSTNITNKAALSASGTDGHEVGANNWITGEYFYQLIDDVATYDQMHPRSGPFDPVAFNELVGKFDPTLFYGINDPIAIQADGQSVAPAIIQAGGAVRLTASNDISNLVVQSTVAAVTGRSANTSVYSATQPSVVLLNRQLPPDLSQQQVNPLSLPGFSLPSGQNGLFRLSGQDTSTANGGPQNWSLGGGSVSTAQHQSQTGTTTQNVARVQGVPASTVSSQPQKYLIETNPVLTDLKQFMSSDYLLAGLGYDPDVSAKRLGDGLYEQRLVQQAVTARTGQAFIDGQTSNEDQFKYLMNNAIASKDALNLTVGVSLTSEQVAALTHDIVWMEDEVVDGQHVLVPVLYLANADNRLTPNGALIQGSDVTLIAGKNLDNVGTLKATNNLSAAAGQDMVNSGLVQAGDRIDLLAGNDLTNKAGGIIAGRDVALTTITGDVINERTVTSSQIAYGQSQVRNDYADSAARIEAANDLSISAGRDVNNAGGVLKSGRDLTLNAGRDVNIVSAQATNSVVRDSNHNNSDTTQLGAVVSAGRDISVQAGRDVTAIASQIDAKRDIAMVAAGDVTLSSAADEEHSLSKGKKLTTQEDHVHQVSTDINAGGNFAVTAGNDLAVISSNITAGKEAYLAAGNNLGVFAAQDSDYSLYDKKSKGSFGAKKTKRDEVTQVTHISSEITSGGDLVLASGGNQHYQAAKLNSGEDLVINSGGSVTFEAVKDLHQESHEKSNSSLAWTSMSGKGSTDETLRQSEMSAKGQLVINAVDGLHIDVKQVNQQTVSQAIDAMVKADPNLAWLKDAEKRGDVDWRMVKEVHDSFKYSHSGLGAGAQIILAIALSVAMGPAGLGLSTTETAVAVSLSTTAINSAISNKGNLGVALKDTFSGSSLKNAAIAGVTAGLIDYADSSWFSDASGAANGGSKVITDGVTQNPGYAASMLKPENWANTLLRSGTHALIDSGVSTAINGGSFGSNLGQALIGEGIDLGAAIGNKAVGDLAAQLNIAPDIVQKVVLHAVLGGLISKATGGDFASGAIAGGVEEGLAPIANNFLSQYVSDRFASGDLSIAGSQAKITTAQIIGLISAGLAGGNPATGSLIGGASEKYNNEQHPKNPIEEVDAEIRHAEGLPITRQEEDDLGKPQVEQIVPGPPVLGVGSWLKGQSLNLNLGSLPSFGDKEVATVVTRTTKNETRLGGQGGELGVKITFEDGTEFDMTSTRVKETMPNPYVAGGFRPVIFDNALDSKGVKRAPTKAELDWFNGISW